MGVFGYADDLSLLCPSLEGLKEMLFLCEQYAIDYKIMFNSKKSKFIYASSFYCEISIVNTNMGCHHLLYIYLYIFLCLFISINSIYIYIYIKNKLLLWERRSHSISYVGTPFPCVPAPLHH